MSRPANVSSLDAIADFRAALDTFRTDGQDAMATIALEIRRAFDWLHDMRNFWERAARTRYDEVVQAKAALNRRKMFHVQDRPPDCSEQEEDLEIAIRRLEEAEDKIDLTCKWGPKLQHATDEFEGQSRRMNDLLDSELPRVLALLARMRGILDEYVAMHAPAPASHAKPAAAPTDGRPRPPARWLRDRVLGSARQAPRLPDAHTVPLAVIRTLPGFVGPAAKASPP
jgi:hypothetical protein